MLPLGVRLEPRVLLRDILGVAALFVLLVAGVVPAVGAQVPEPKPGPTTIDQAIERLSDADLSVDRVLAADLMGRKGYGRRRELAPILRRALLGDRNPDVRASAGRALGRLGSRSAVPDLIRALADPSANVRVVAAAALWRLPDPSSVASLVKATADGDPAVREWSAMALGVSGDVRAVAPLGILLKDSSVAIRLAAVRGLGKLREPSSLQALREHAIGEGLGQEEFREVIISLSSLRGSAKVNALVGLLRRFPEDEARQVEIVRALGRVGDALVLPALRRAAAGAKAAALRKQLAAAMVSVEKRIQKQGAAR